MFDAVGSDGGLRSSVSELMVSPIATPSFVVSFSSMLGGEDGVEDLALHVISFLLAGSILPPVLGAVGNV